MQLYLTCNSNGLEKCDQPKIILSAIHFQIYIQILLYNFPTVCNTLLLNIFLLFETIDHGPQLYMYQYDRLQYSPLDFFIIPSS